MRAGLILVVILLAGCSRFENERTPMAATRSFVQAAQRGNCKRAWSLLSSDRQEKINAEFEKLRGRGRVTSVDELYCKPGPHNPFGNLDPSTSEGNGEDTAAIDASDGTRFNVTCLKEGAGYKVHRISPR